MTIILVQDLGSVHLPIVLDLEDVKVALGGNLPLKTLVLFSALAGAEVTLGCVSSFLKDSALV